MPAICISMQKDHERTAKLEANGIRVVRFRNEQVLERPGDVEAMLWKVREEGQKKREEEGVGQGRRGADLIPGPSPGRRRGECGKSDECETKSWSFF